MAYSARAGIHTPAMARGTMMHIQEVSDTSSSVAEHDLGDMLDSPARGFRYPERHNSVSARIRQIEQRGYPYDGGSPHLQSRPQGVLPGQLMPHSLAQTVRRPHQLPPPGSSATRYSYRDLLTAENRRLTFAQSTPLMPDTSSSYRTGQDYFDTAHTSDPFEEQDIVDPYDHSKPVKSPFVPSWTASSPNPTIEGDSGFAASSPLLDSPYHFHVGFNAHEPKRLTEQRKAARMKALEREFGKQDLEKFGEFGLPLDKERSGEMTSKERRAYEKAKEGQMQEELGVGKDGRLLTQGRMKRMALRCAQHVLGLIAILGSVGGAIFTHPDIKNLPPPSGKLTSWLLYVFSILSFIVTFWLFAVRPCIRKRKGLAATTAPAHISGHGGFAIPIVGHQGPAYNVIGGQQTSSKWPFRGGKRKGQGNLVQQPMTVNLVVDPMALSRAAGLSAPPSRYNPHDAEDDNDEAEHAAYYRKVSAERVSGRPASIPKDSRTALLSETDEIIESLTAPAADLDEDMDFYIPDSRKKKGQFRRPLNMLDTMSAMSMQDRWRAARSSMRRQAVEDGVLGLFWAVVAIVCIAYGGTCKPGSGSGFCDLYNLSLASGVLLSTCFWTSFSLDVLDLRRSRTSPRIARTY